MTALACDGNNVAGIPVSSLTTDAARLDAYQTLAAAGTVPHLIMPEDQDAAIFGYRFYLEYTEPDSNVTAAAVTTLNAISTKVSLNQAFDLTLDGYKCK